ncbi:MAG: hypothetical protein GU345_01490 [Acidilobus sp.]|nr:hypothetical protein [Acidilobus sp.]
MDLRELTTSLISELKLRTKPVAVKLLGDGLGDLSSRVMRPLRDFKRKLAFCQMVAMSRYYGFAVGAEMGEISCPGTLLVLGMMPPPPFVKEGMLSLGLYAETREAAAKIDSSLPSLRPGSAKAIATAPLDEAPFEPDAFLVYGTPGQMVKLAAAYVYKTGEPLRLETFAKAGSDTAVAAALREGRPRLFLPGLGDRMVGRVEDYEMGFASPMSWLPEIVDGLKKQTSLGFITYPPAPILTYTARFDLIPVVGEYYKKVLEEAERLAGGQGGQG